MGYFKDLMKGTVLRDWFGKKTAEQNEWDAMFERAEDARESLKVLNEPDVAEAAREYDMTGPLGLTQLPPDVMAEFEIGDFTYEDAEAMKWDDAELKEMGWFDELKVENSNDQGPVYRAPGNLISSDPVIKDDYAYAGQLPAHPDKVVGAWHPAAAEALEAEVIRLSTLVNKLTGRGGASNYVIYVSPTEFDAVMEGQMPEMWQDDAGLIAGEQLADNAIRVIVEFTW